MQAGFFEKQIVLTPDLCSSAAALSPLAAFTIFQGIASEHAERIGVGGAAFVAAGRGTGSLWLSVIVASLKCWLNRSSWHLRQTGICPDKHRPAANYHAQYSATVTGRALGQAQKSQRDAWKFLVIPFDRRYQIGTARL